MKRFIEGEGRSQAILFPEYLDDWIGEDNPVRVIDVFIEEIELKDLGFQGADPAVTGRPVNNRDKNFTPRKLEARKQQLETSVERYLAELDREAEIAGRVITQPQLKRPATSPLKRHSNERSRPSDCAGEGVSARSPSNIELSKKTPGVVPRILRPRGDICARSRKSSSRSRSYLVRSLLNFASGSWNRIGRPGTRRSKQTGSLGS